MLSPEDMATAWTLRAMIARADTDNTLAAAVLQVLRAAHREIAERIIVLGLSDMTRARLQAVLREAERLLDEAYAVAHGTATTMLAKVDAAERTAIPAVIDALRGSLNTTFTGIPRALVVQSALLPSTIDAIPLKGIGFGEWWSRGAKAALQRVEQQVQVGIVNGENPIAIARRVFHAKSSSSKATGGIAWRGTVSTARMVLRTATTAVQSRAALDSFRLSGIERVRFDAVLDLRTSITCAGLDNGEYALDDPMLPIPPMHPQCRSTLVPLVTITKADGTVMTVRTRPTSYDAWLRAQSATMQDKVLGKSRGAIYRRIPSLKLFDIITSGGRILNLDELASKLGPIAL